MLLFKTIRSFVIFVLLIISLFAISECKRGGGGRIFRTTILKGRRNQRRSRDVRSVDINEPEWTDSLLLSRKISEQSAGYYYNDFLKNGGNGEQDKATEELPEVTNYNENSGGLKEENKDVVVSTPNDKDYKESYFLNKLLFNFSINEKSQYYIYSYYNNPKQIVQHTTVSMNSVVPCPKMLASLCYPDTVPVCLKGDKILCIVSNVPCKENSILKCAHSSTTQCENRIGNKCANNKDIRNHVNKDIPCLTNVTFRAGKKEDNEETTVCVVFMIVPKTKKEPDDANGFIFI